ncbi:MAG: bifunctional hydroxymethylpyrimidine kinase/phosphomethylpyrimidine kinase, partial [Desulfuromonadales bacterium]|nr:bifunctional hydroxymethylpyrimidine kinase/phosphomethylpyrimidine kinase [Desulfuromonadales bacterium]
GIQADIKTISLLGSYAASAITALTAQNTLGVKGVSPVSADFVAKQSRMVLDDIGADTLKTGMLYGAETVCTVAKLIKEYNLLSVIDPVMIAKGGAALLKPDAVEALRSELLSAAYLLTPNIPEAEALTGLKIESVEEMEGAAEALQQMGARNLLIKGGHKEGDATDVLLTSDGVLHLTSERTETENTHGTGCSYAAALATLLAQGQPLKQAAQQAKTFISAAIAQATPLGQGHGPINHVAGAQALRNEST